MSIYDCIMYFDEDLILDIRFNILNNNVKKFVIVEATRDHAGNKKKLNFDIQKFQKFKDKIIYHVVDDIPEKVENYKKGWSPNFYRENFHRNSIQRALNECEQDDLIVISDADEIPNLDLLNKIKIKKYALFSQQNYLYKLNLLSGTNWLGSAICYKKYLKSPQWLRNKRFLRRGFIRRIFFKTQIIQNGGWHFSFLKTPEDILKKINSYAHGEIKNIKDVEAIKKSIDAKKYWASSEINLTKVPIDSNFPDYIRENEEIFKEWIV